MVDQNAPRPVVGALVYLAVILPEVQGTPYLASFDRTTSPRTTTDSQGRFVFADVAPTDYSLVLDRVSEAYLLWDPTQAEGADFIFTSQPGQVLELGELVYSHMPGESPTP
jgi:hypothetical protein